MTQTLPEKVVRGTWVQTEREAHEAWAKLIRRSPKAAELMHLITARIGENNAVVMSIPTIMKLMDASRPTVVRAIKLLRDDRWVQTVQIGGSGTTNAYVVNDRVAWTGPRDGIRFSLFSAMVITTDDEQPDRDQLDGQKPLRKLPHPGELQIPSGEGLPPPSQPFLGSMEPDLPASSPASEPNLYSPIPEDVARAIHWWKGLEEARVAEWNRIIGTSVSIRNSFGEIVTRRRSEVEMAVESYKMSQEMDLYHREAIEAHTNKK